MNDLLNCAARFYEGAKRATQFLCRMSIVATRTVCIVGADGGIRTRTRVAPQRFLRPRRLPFRHARASQTLNREHTVLPDPSTRKHPGTARVTLERKTGFEPATFSLARRCSTTEPLPRRFCPSMIVRRPTPVNSTNEHPGGHTARIAETPGSNICSIRFFPEHWSALSGLSSD